VFAARGVSSTVPVVAFAMPAEGTSIWSCNWPCQLGLGWVGFGLRMSILNLPRGAFRAPVGNGTLMACSEPGAVVTRSFGYRPYRRRRAPGRFRGARLWRG
jgi:hypothetical protein